MSRRVFAATAAIAIMTGVLLLVLARGTGPTSFLSFVAIAEAAGGQGAQAEGAVRAGDVARRDDPADGRHRPEGAGAADGPAAHGHGAGRA